MRAKRKAFLRFFENPIGHKNGNVKLQLMRWRRAGSVSLSYIAIHSKAPSFVVDDTLARLFELDCQLLFTLHYKLCNQKLLTSLFHPEPRSDIKAHQIRRRWQPMESQSIQHRASSCLQHHLAPPPLLRSHLHLHFQSSQHPSQWPCWSK